MNNCIAMDNKVAMNALRYGADIAVFEPFNVTAKDKTVVYGISIAFSFVGLVGAMSIIIHAMAKKIVYNLEVRPLFHLSIANTGFCVFFMTISSIHLSMELSNLSVDMDKISPASIVIATLEETFYLISFLLTANYSLTVYVRLKDRLNVLEQLKPLRAQTEVRFVLKLAYVLSWLLPMVLLFPISASVFGKQIEVELCPLCPSITFHPKENSTGAFDSSILQNFGLFALVLTFVIATTAILILYNLSRRVSGKLHARNDVQDNQMDSIRRLLNKLSCYTVCFLISWTPIFVTAVVILTVVASSDDCRNCVYLLCIWGITAPCQGFLNAVVYFYFTNYQLGRAVTEPSPSKPIASQTYRFYGSGNQRTKWPKVRTPSPSMSESSDSNVITALPPKKKRSPSFLTLLDNEGYEQTT